MNTPLNNHTIGDVVLTPELAATLTPNAVMRSCMLQALTQQYGQQALRSANLTDERLDRVIKGLARIPEAFLSGDAEAALRRAEEASEEKGNLFRPPEPDGQGVSVRQLRFDALGRLVIAAGARRTLTDEDYTTETPFGLVFEPRRTTLRKAVRTGVVSELGDTSYEAFDVEAFQNCVLIRATLRTVTPARLCGTEGHSKDEILVIDRTQALGSVPDEDLSVVLHGLTEELPGAFEDACAAAFGEERSAEDWAEHLERLIRSARPQTSATPTP